MALCRFNGAQSVLFGLDEEVYLHVNVLLSDPLQIKTSPLESYVQGKDNTAQKTNVKENKKMFNGKHMTFHFFLFATIRISFD